MVSWLGIKLRMSDINARYALLAACMMHVEGAFSTASQAFKHKNPGNIMLFHQDGTREERTYATYQDGFDALVEDIAANAGKTLTAFLSKYAPPNENNTSLYLQVVSDLSGIKPGEII